MVSSCKAPCILALIIYGLGPRPARQASHVWLVADCNRRQAVGKSITGPHALQLRRSRSQFAQHPLRHVITRVPAIVGLTSASSGATLYCCQVPLPVGAPGHGTPTTRWPTLNLFAPGPFFSTVATPCMTTCLLVRSRLCFLPKFESQTLVLMRLWPHLSFGRPVRRVHRCADDLAGLHH